MTIRDVLKRIERFDSKRSTHILLYVFDTPFAYSFHPNLDGAKRAVSVALFGVVEVDTTFPGITRDGNRLFFYGYLLGMVVDDQPTNLAEGYLLTEVRSLYDALLKDTLLRRYLDFLNQDLATACQLAWRALEINRSDWFYTAAASLGTPSFCPEFLVPFIAITAIVFSVGELISANNVYMGPVYRKKRTISTA